MVRFFKVKDFGTFLRLTQRLERKGCGKATFSTALAWLSHSEVRRLLVLLNVGKQN